MERSHLGSVLLSLSGLTLLACSEAAPPGESSLGSSSLFAQAPAGKQLLKGHVTKQMLAAPRIGSVPRDTLISIEIGLPLRNGADLDAIIGKITSPSSGLYRQPLSLADFVARYSPTAANYAALVSFVRAQGLAVVHTFPNRLLVAARARAVDIERVFHTTLGVRLRSDGTPFFAPDREPSVDFDVPVLHVSGLDDFLGRPEPDDGSGEDGLFQGVDFRNAYAECTPLRGEGQRVGIVALDGYTPVDITTYARDAGLAEVPRRDVLLDGFSGRPSGNERSLEVALDIEMVMSMAPGLDEIVVFQGMRGNNVLSAMASESPLIRVLSSSWGLGADENTRQLLRQLAAQGQSLVQSSGDDGSFIGAINRVRDESLATVVGGTVLTMEGAGEAWQEETAWWGGGGGISQNPRPDYQRAVDMSTNGGSTTNRNLPDVALVARSVRVVGTLAAPASARNVSGTSISSPLFAGFLALVNQRSALEGVGPIGFANPSLYAIGSVPALAASCFHDVTSGDNGDFTAVPGFDLTTGWGSPRCSLLAQLASASPTVPIPTYPVLQVRVSTGDDDLRGNSAATLDVVSATGDVTQTFTLKPNPEPAWGWADAREFLLPLAAPLSAMELGGVNLHLIQGGSFPDTEDNWNVESLQVRLIQPGGDEVCVIDSVGHPVVRLTGAGGSKSFAAGTGCPPLTGTPRPRSRTVNTVELVLGTGSDDLRGNSSARADLFAAGATSPFFTFSLKGAADPGFAGAAVNLFQITFPEAHPLSDFDRLVISMTQGGSWPDETDFWNIQSVSLTAFNPGEVQSCLVNLMGAPVARVDGSVTFAARSGCP